MGGSDGCRNDILLIVWEYDILAVLLVGLWAHRLLLGGLWASKAGSRCMETTIRRAISSPSASVNNPWLAYIWMYVCWGAHLDTYRDIWVRRVIIIIDTCYVLLSCLLCIPVMIPVIPAVHVMTPVMYSCHSCYDSCYVIPVMLFLLWPLCNSVVCAWITIIWDNGI